MTAWLSRHAPSRESAVKSSYGWVATVRSFGRLSMHRAGSRLFPLDLIGNIDQGYQRMLRTVYHAHRPGTGWKSSHWELQFLRPSYHDVVEDERLSNVVNHRLEANKGAGIVSVARCTQHVTSLTLHPIHDCPGELEMWLKVQRSDETQRGASRTQLDVSDDGLGTAPADSSSIS